MSLDVNPRFNEDLHLVLRGDQPEYNRMIGNMLTGRLYLSSELGGGVFDEASRSLDEEQVQIIDADLSTFRRWSVRGIQIRFSSHPAETPRRRVTRH